MKKETVIRLVFPRTYRQSKLQQLTEDFGFSDIQNMLEAYVYDSVSPAICMNENCNYSTEYEPDQDKGYCEICHSQTVVSAFILAGII